MAFYVRVCVRYIRSECDTYLWFQVADVSVEVATVGATLNKLCRRYNRRRRKPKKLKKKNPILNLQNLAILITVVVFVIVVIMWSLLWVFIYLTSLLLTVIRDLSAISNNNQGGVLVHFWMIFDCVSAILKDSVHMSLKNRSSVGFLQGLPVDIDSILVNVALRSDYTSTAVGESVKTDKNIQENRVVCVPDVSVPLNVFSSWGGLSCYIKLTSIPGSVIRLTVKSLLIDPSACIYDALTVYDALLPMRGMILYSICMSVICLIVMLKPFRLSHLECMNMIALPAGPGDAGVITRQFYPSLLPRQCSCTWMFQTPSIALGVALRFQNYMLKLKDLYCGNYTDHSTVFRIPGQNPEVVFRCSSRYADQPFSANYNSYNTSQPCPEGHFPCSTGLCVENFRHCDGLDDCQDESDEVFCCTLTTKSCKPGSSTIMDCSTGKDETNCTQETSCSGVSYQCGNGACIFKKNAKWDALIAVTRRTACGNPTPSKRVSDSAATQQRIVGGINAVEGEWPWQHVGASVLSDEWLISVAHRFSKERLADPRMWTAHLGMLNQGSAKHVAEILRIVVHGYYSVRNFDYDIALVQLKKAWPSSLEQYIQPICLPAPSQTFTEGHRCWVTGWGYRSEQDTVLPTVLQKAEVSIISQSECKRSYGAVSPRMLCAGVPSGEQDACRGDSGGPLSCQAHSGGRWFLTGIVSWGSGCGRPNLPGDWVCHKHLYIVYS
uniref:Peptidase S1 domain-containing protein n=1 Tax=Sinocyclocheilus anshuiensis TaxID=1608454 RepID=A0A671RUU3_9TELE